MPQVSSPVNAEKLWRHVKPDLLTLFTHPVRIRRLIKRQLGDGTSETLVQAELGERRAELMEWDRLRLTP